MKHLNHCAFLAKPHEPHEPPKNYGADINTLIELLEAGEL